MKNREKLISIVAPFYNEGESARYFYEAMLGVFSTLPDYTFELVCIDDGSKDQTLNILIELAQLDSRVRVVELSRNFGKEAALTAGLNEALGVAVIPIDADLQDPPELIHQMIEQWACGAEVVLAKRTDRASDSFLKRKTAQMFYKLHNNLSSLKIPENVGDFRLMDRVVVDALKLLPEQHRFMKGLFAWVGYRTVVLNYARNARVAGETKFSAWKLWNFALEGITGFSAIPLKLWSYVGGIGAVTTLIYAIYIVIRTGLYGVDVPGYASLLVAVLFFGSLQLVGIGILGEYISRIYMETKNRPLYLIRERHNFKNINEENA